MPQRILSYFFKRNHLAPAFLRRVGRLRGGDCRSGFHEAADFLRRAPLHIVGDVRIGVQSEARAVVPQHAGQGLHILSIPREIAHLNRSN